MAKYLPFNHKDLYLLFSIQVEMPAIVTARYACNPSAQEVKAGGSLGLLVVQCTVVGELQAVEDSKEVGSMSEEDTRGCPLACIHASMHTHTRTNP